MSTLIALLRGVNIGSRQVKMAELRLTFEEAGFKGVSTYIQTGNVLFEATGEPLPLVESRIEDLMKSKFGFDVPTIVVTPEDLAGILESSPFRNDADKTTDRTYLTLLKETPDPELVEKLLLEDHSPESFVLEGTTIYFHSPNGYARAVMNNNYFEKKLKVWATTRNWRTMTILAGQSG